MALSSVGRWAYGNQSVSFWWKIRYYSNKLTRVTLWPQKYSEAGVSRVSSSSDFCVFHFPTDATPQILWKINLSLFLVSITEAAVTLKKKKRFSNSYICQDRVTAKSHYNWSNWMNSQKRRTLVQVAKSVLLTDSLSTRTTSKITSMVITFFSLKKNGVGVSFGFIYPGSLLTNRTQSRSTLLNLNHTPKNHQCQQFKQK